MQEADDRSDASSTYGPTHNACARDTATTSSHASPRYSNSAMIIEIIRTAAPCSQTLLFYRLSPGIGVRYLSPLISATTSRAIASIPHCPAGVDCCRAAGIIFASVSNDCQTCIRLVVPTCTHIWPFLESRISMSSIKLPRLCVAALCGPCLSIAELKPKPERGRPAAYRRGMPRSRGLPYTVDPSAAFDKCAQLRAPIYLLIKAPSVRVFRPRKSSNVIICRR